MAECKKCNKEFNPSKGLLNYCSVECRNSRTWDEKDKQKKSISAKNSRKVLEGNKIRGLLKKQETEIKRKNQFLCRIQTKEEKRRQANEKLKKSCPICLNVFYHKEKIYCSRGCFRKDSNCKFRKKSKGGFRKNSGRGKCGWYKGYWSQSSWELAWIIYNLDHGIKFERNNEGFEYEFEKKKYKFYPDFIVGKTYIEIKGYTDSKTNEKIKQFPLSLKVLYKKDLREVFEYVENKYGKDFVKLYENNC